MCKCLPYGSFHSLVFPVFNCIPTAEPLFFVSAHIKKNSNHSFNWIIVQVNLMRQEVTELDKNMENRHTDVTDRDLVLSLDQLDTSQPVTMFGYLFKRTTNAFKSWNRRYFTLQNNQLVYRKRSGKEVQ